MNSQNPRNFLGANRGETPCQNGKLAVDVIADLASIHPSVQPGESECLKESEESQPCRTW